MAKAEVILELSGIEASVLLDILSLVGGKPSGRRGAADSIKHALERLGIGRVRGAKGGITL